MIIGLTLGKVSIKKRDKFVTRAVPHSPNRKMHWAEKARWKKEWHEAVRWAWLETDASNRHTWSLKSSMPTVKILIYTREKMDRDNEGASLKPIYDGLVRCGALVDDSPKHVHMLSPKSTIVKDLNKERIEIILQR